MKQEYTPEQMQRILEAIFPRGRSATQPAPVETKVEVKIDDKPTTEKENTK
jgi:hypothetical protein